MVWHQYELVRHYVREMRGDFAPATADDAT